MSEPFGWVFQHEETGHMSFCPNDGINTPKLFAHINSRFTLCGPVYTRPAPSEAEVEAAAKRMVKLCSPPKGASFEQACEWVPPTIEDLARAALGVGE